MLSSPMPWRSLWSWGLFFWTIVVVFVLASALTVVWVKHQIRLTSTELHKTLKQEYNLRVEEGRLSLEYNHLLSRTRIERQAKERLGMMPISPLNERILLLPEEAMRK